MITVNDTADLFQLLTIALPYEYDEYLNKTTETIEITKEGSDIIVYITEDETEPETFDVTSYVTESDELPLCEGIRFDIMDPDFNLKNAINEIKQLF